MESTTEPTWTLVHGCHRGTLISRDSTSRSGFSSLEECRAKLTEHEAFYRSIGYMIWFAYAVGPDGTKHTLHAGNAYR